MWNRMAPDPQLGKAPLIRSFSETTAVDFAELSPELIRAYIATGTVALINTPECFLDRLGTGASDEQQD